MTGSNKVRPDYGNWVPKRLIYGSAIAGLAFLISTAWIVYLAILAILFFSFTAYLAFARHEFSSHGGGIQNSIRELVLDNLDWDGAGRALDIGCGNGALAIMVAKNYPEAEVTGIDYWGKRWEYSRDVCESNAEIEGVDGRVTFQKASAVSLPFEDGHFDAVVGNFVFQEVGGVRDKRELIREALRVVKKGGSFSFQDEFLVRASFGDPEDLVETVKSWGMDEVKFVRTRDAEFIPRSLKLPMILGAIAILAGRK